MIPGDELVRLLASPDSGLAVTPLIDESQIGEASVDIRLGPDIIVTRRATGATAFDAADAPASREALRARQQYIRRGLGDSFHLQPGEFAIARSLEYVALPAGISAQALGRSSWGRLGLTIATATMVNPGFRGTVTLELANVANTALVLHVGVRVAQLVFTGEVDRGHMATRVGRRLRTRAQRRAATNWIAEYRQPKPSRYLGQLKPELSRVHEDRDLLWVAPVSVRYIIGIVGHRFAGKSSVVEYLVARRGFRLYRFMHVIRDEAERRGLDPNDVKVQRQVGDAMRRESGRNDILARLVFDRIRRDHLDADRRHEPAPLVVEGFKLVEELTAFGRLAAFRPLLVKAEPLTRLRRAEAGGWLGRVSSEPVPPVSEPQARLRWLREHVDEPSDQRYLLGPLVACVEGRRQTLHIANDPDNLPRLHDLLNTSVRSVERRWRGGQLEPDPDLRTTFLGSE